MTRGTMLGAPCLRIPVGPAVDDVVIARLARSNKPDPSEGR